MLKNIALAAIAAATLASPHIGHAAQIDREAIVRFGDLNLASSAGQAMLASRISAAANKVCYHFGTITLQQFMEQRTCRDELRDRAIDAVNGQMAFNDQPSMSAAASR
ncbi:UrcA family protein [Allosphingosinicella indica]|uniref:UrcA family protein n=1 Tax=Allosphingosinicella indica TaxID=941907 RepID=A0A1X7FZ98_9SPHN|nr:UrcA family protein [Allosphingosinicella indica]SMF61438.1 UrcA family protein [Allosphingosinicella indica]